MRIEQVWQTHLQIIFQVYCPKTDEIEPSKFYLTLLVDLPKCDVISSNVKPTTQAQKQPSGILGLLRKYLKGTVIQKIMKHERFNAFWFFLSRGDETFCISMDSKPSPELSIILGDGTNVLRFGTQGIFTHKKTGEAPLSELEAFLPFDIHTLTDQNNAAITNVPQGASKLDALGAPQRELRRKLQRRIKTLLKSKPVVPSQAQIQTRKFHAEALRFFFYKLSASELILDQTELLQMHDAGFFVPPGLEEVTVKLPENVARGKLLDYFFSKVDKLEKSKTIETKRLLAFEKQLEKLESQLKQVDEGILDPKAIETVGKKFNLKLGDEAKNENTKHLHHDEGPNFRFFTDERGIRYFVGRNAEENDVLTKQAKSQDYWFHALGVSGSHVIVAAKDLKQNRELDPLTKKRACWLAIHFSSNRGSGQGDVHFTQRSHVKKKKGLAIGAWVVDKSETAYEKINQEELKILLS